MAMTPEAKVKKKIKAWLNARDIFSFSPIGGAYAARGIPDLICCVHGKFVGIEVKAPGKIKNTSALQDAQIELIKESGGIAFVADSLEIVEAEFAKHKLLAGATFER